MNVRMRRRLDRVLWIYHIQVLPVTGHPVSILILILNYLKNNVIGRSVRLVRFQPWNGEEELPTASSCFVFHIQV